MLKKALGLKNIAAVFVGMLIFVAADCLLGLLGVPSLSQRDDFAGFADTKLFIEMERDGSRSVFGLNPARERYFNPQQFVMPKPEREFRIFSFGGSTTYGRPYIDATSFSRWLEQLLNRYCQANRFRVVNVGGISYASHRVLALMREMIAYQPDLFVVYAGHNEFLEDRTYSRLKNENPLLRKIRAVLHRSRIYSLLKVGMDRVLGKKTDGGTLPAGEVRARLEQIGGPDLYHRDPAYKKQIIEQFRNNVETMVALARERQIPIVLCTVPANLSGISPFKSEHRDGLTAEEWVRWQRYFEQGRAALARGAVNEALKLFEKAETIDNQYAALFFFKGRALESLGRYVEAYAAYVRAKEEDVIPLRALEAFNRILRDVARRQQVPLADVEKFFLRVSAHGIPGDDLFVDHVHPGIEGQQIISWVIINSLSEAGLVPMTFAEWQKVQLDARAFLREKFEAVSTRYRAMGLWGVGRLYYWAGKRREAYRPLLQAYEVVKDIPEIPRKLGLLELDRGNPVAALEFLGEAERREPGHPWAVIGMANAYTLLGQTDKALELLAGLPAAWKRDYRYHEARARAFHERGQYAAAVAAYEKALAANPASLSLEREMARALLAAGQAEKANEHIQAFLQKARMPVSAEMVKFWLQNTNGMFGRKMK